MKLTIFLSLSLAASIHGATFEVSNAGDLNNALNSVNPGDVINLHDGYYQGNFQSSRSGNDGAPITMQGSRNAVLAGSGGNYGFFLKANHWVLQGFSVRDSLKGIVLERASNNILDNLEVSNIQQEGIHFRTNSADNILRNSYIHDTGTVNPGFGEGVYLGQAFHNWADGQQDKSDRNQVVNNHIGPNVAAECVDIKEGSCCGYVGYNTFDGTGEKGENYADSWIDVKGDSYVIEENTGTNSYKNGFDIHHISQAGMGGCNNVIQNNHCNNLPAGGQCVANSSGGCSNTITNNN